MTKVISNKNMQVQRQNACQKRGNANLDELPPPTHPLFTYV
jgi:hypothetical protein